MVVALRKSCITLANKPLVTGELKGIRVPNLCFWFFGSCEFLLAHKHTDEDWATCCRCWITAPLKSVSVLAVESPAATTGGGRRYGPLFVTFFLPYQNASFDGGFKSPQGELSHFRATYNTGRKFPRGERCKKGTDEAPSPTKNFIFCYCFYRAPASFLSIVLVTWVRRGRLLWVRPTWCLYVPLVPLCGYGPI